MPCYWIKDGFRMERIDTEEWFQNKLEQVKDHPAYLMEKRRLEMDKLERKVIRDKVLYCLDAKESTKEDIADDILAIFDGWKSPEEVKTSTIDNMRFFCNICKYNPEK
jgi:hypothetical protein